jgi:hypothetical protein
MTTSLGLGRRRPRHLAVVPWAHQFGLGPLGQDAGKTMANELYHGGWPPRPIEIPMSWLSGRAMFRQDPPFARAEVGQRGGDTARARNTASVINGREWVFTATVDSIVDVDGSNLAAWITAYYTDPLPRSSAMSLILNSRTPTEIWRILSVVQGSRIRITGSEPATMTTSALDPFPRVTAAGFGVEPVSGLTYTVTGGSAADYSTDGATAAMSIASLSTLYRAQLALALADFDVTVTNTLSTTLTGGGAQADLSVRMRYVDDNNFVDLLIFRTPTAVTMATRYRTAGVDIISSFPTISGAAGNSPITMRLVGIGTTLEGYAWVTGTAPPTAPQVTLTGVTMLTAGSTELTATLNASVTNVLPLTAGWDNLAASTPNGRAWPDGATELVVECVSHQVDADRRVVQWALAPIVGSTAGAAGPWFYSDSSSTSGSDSVPF